MSTNEPEWEEGFEEPDLRDTVDVTEVRESEAPEELVTLEEEYSERLREAAEDPVLPDDERIAPLEDEEA